MYCARLYFILYFVHFIKIVEGVENTAVFIAGVDKNLGEFEDTLGMKVCILCI